jgi:hypothetical protein
MSSARLSLLPLRNWTIYVLHGFYRKGTVWLISESER